MQAHMKGKQTQIATTTAGPVVADGLLRISQIVGRAEVTERQAKKNRKTGRGPRRPKAAIPAILPIGKSSWWQGIRDGRYPKPVPKPIAPGTTSWRVSDINALLQRLGRA